MRPLVRFLSGLVLALALSAALSAESALAQDHYRVVQATGAGIVSGTTLVPGSQCDDCVAGVVLPFDFVYYGQTFAAGTTAFVSSNGNLQFSSSSNDYGEFGVCFPLSLFNNVILAHWTDIQTAGAGEGIYTSVTGSAPNRIFNIEWRASYDFFPPNSLNFEIRLYESLGPAGQRFEIVYGTLGGSGTSAPGEGITIPAIGSQRGTTGAGAGLMTQVNSACGLLGGGVRSGLRLAFIDHTSLSIHGRAINTEGQPLSGVTVVLSGPGGTSSKTTASDGTYAFDGLSFNGTYTVTAADAGGSEFYPQSRAFSPSGIPFNGTKVVNFVRTPLPQARDLLISELRFRGPPPVITEDFVELYNNTNSTIVVNTNDGTSGWLVLASNGASFIIQNGTVIPPRRHFLVSGTGYFSLYGYAPGDEFFSGNLADDSGVAVFSTVAINLSTPAGTAAALSKRLDAAGFTTACAPAVDPCVFREGAGIAPIGPNGGEYSFLRKSVGNPRDTDNNASDFVFVATDGGVYGGVQSVLGAPGPENLTSPVQRNAQLKSSFISSCTGQSTEPDSTCARVRLTADTGSNATHGTLLIRRRWTNRMNVPITRLRFRIVDITTAPAPACSGPCDDIGDTADLRVLDSANRTVGGTVALKGLTVEDSPPAQTLGGGLNTSLRVNDITLASPLAPNDSVNVEFRLGVVQRGNFRFLVNVEAVADEPLPASGGSAPSRAGASPSKVSKQ